jgi:hypothetical protein
MEELTMPSLESLASPQARDEFSKCVARDAIALRSGAVDVNDGITTTEQLNAHLVKGREVSFNFQRLIDESHTYK